MEQFKRAKVVMLPGKKSEICLANNKLCEIDKSTYELSHIKTQHLNIISDDEIKEGDWCLIDNNKVGKRTNKQTYPNCTDGESHLCYYYIINGEERSYHVSYCKKIIATTDTSLKPSCTCTESAAIYCGSKCQISLPQPSQQFIEKYIEEYNKGNIITDVLVEYEPGYVNPEWNKEKLKINPKDNTITIKKIKDSWNREKVIELIYKYCKEMTQCVSEEDEKWIEKNL